MQIFKLPFYYGGFRSIRFFINSLPEVSGKVKVNGFRPNALAPQSPQSNNGVKAGKPKQQPDRNTLTLDAGHSLGIYNLGYIYRFGGGRGSDYFLNQTCGAVSQSICC